MYFKLMHGANCASAAQALVADIPLTKTKFQVDHLSTSMSFFSPFQERGPSDIATMSLLVSGILQ